MTAVVVGMALAAWALNVVYITVLAWPFSWLWNSTLSQFGIPDVGYWRALGVLLLWRILREAGKGFKASVKLRKAGD